MPGFNTETYLEECRSKATGGAVGRAATQHFSDSDALIRINRALARLAARLKVSRLSASAPETLTNGTYIYSLPAQRMNQLLNIRIKRADGTSYNLAYRNWEFMRSNFTLGDVTRDSGEPAYYTFYNVAGGAGGERNGYQVEIRPVPTWTLASGLQYDFPRAPQQLSRISNQTTITATVTLNSATVTLSGADASILPGDEFAIIETTQTDGVTDQDPIGRVWYRVYNVVGAVLTLEETYRGTSGATKQYQGAQVPDVEQAFPGQLGMVPAWMALADFNQINSPATARLLMQDVEAVLQGVRIETPDKEGWDRGMMPNIIGFRTGFMFGGRTYPPGSGNWWIRP